MDYFDLLQTISEVSAAFAGFTAIIVIFRPQDLWEERDVVGFVHFLQLSLGAVLLSPLPIFLSSLNSVADFAWRISNGVLGIYHLYVLAWLVGRMRRKVTYQSFTPSLGSWVREPWLNSSMYRSPSGWSVTAEIFTYLLGLLWILAMAMANFVWIFLGSIRRT